LTKKTEDEEILLAAVKEENEKLKEVWQLEINEYKVHCNILSSPYG